MRIFHNTGTRQMIVTQGQQAFSVFLQADEVPAKKAEDLIAAYAADKANLSVCEDILLDNDGNPLPVEDGPTPDRSNDVTNPTKGDDKTN
jgi:hypothetical protein